MVQIYRVPIFSLNWNLSISETNFKINYSCFKKELLLVRGAL